MDPERIINLAGDVGGGDLADRLRFLVEIDKLKSIIRRNLLVDGSRLENVAEHSWHLAMVALVLAPYADDEVDVGRAVAILLVHDLVEIDAGDTYVYDEVGRQTKEAAETEAADRIFALLPGDDGAHLRSLWDEYEARHSPTARFAYAVDRLQPMLLNAASNGRSWMDNGVRHSQAHAVNSAIESGSTQLWAFAEAVLAEAAGAGLLIDDRSPWS